MRMYIGNATKCIVEFHYRLPEHPGVIMQRIPIGAQIALSRDLSTPDINLVLKQNAAYGLVSADEIDRRKEFHGLCYSLGNPISSVKLSVAIERNTQVLVDQGRKMRETFAIAQSNNLENDAVRQDVGRLVEYDMSVVEEDRRKTSAEAENPHKPVAEGVRVRKAGGGDGSSSRKRKAA